MTRPAPTWTGLDLTALPYESYMSLLFRFCWRNVLEWHVLYDAFGTRGSQARTLNVQAMAKETFGLIVQERYKQMLAEQDDRWQYKRFRFCSICLEACYHSYLFQCHMLTRCPIHAVPLQTFCMCCGAQTPQSEPHRYPFLRAYLCVWCHRPLAGAEPSLEAHLELRAVQGSLVSTLGPYEGWWRETSTMRKSVEKMIRIAGSPMQQRWCQVDEFERSICGQGSFGLDHLREGYYPAAMITRFTWRLRAHKGIPNPYSYYYGEHGRRLTSPSLMVYRCVLRRLMRWVGKAVGHTVPEVEREVEAIRFGWHKGARSEVLALWLMRLQLEVRLTSLLSEQPPFCDPPQLSKDCTTFADLNYESAPRLAWRGMFYALFSAWLTITQREQHLHFADYLRGIRDPRDLIFFRHEVKTQYWCELPGTRPNRSDETWYEGEVAFLTVPGLFGSGEGRAERSRDNSTSDDSA